MADDKGPSLQDRRLPYIAPLVIAVLVILIGAVTILYRPAEPPSPSPPTPPKQSAIKPALPPIVVTKPSVLSRADLISASRKAADEFTLLGRLPTVNDPLVGRRFAIKIPFGCGGNLGEYSPAQLSKFYNAETQSITLTATPGIWTTLPVLQASIADSDIEAVEGFWLPRPWTSSDSCPVQTNYPIPPTPTPPTGQTLGLGQLFAAGSSRVQRHADHPYIFTRKLTSSDTTSVNHAYRLVLEGRIVGYKDGRSLQCWTEAPDHHPLCIYSVAFDRVAFEDVDSGEILVNWND